MNKEPVIAVGLVENASAATIHFLDDYSHETGTAFPAGTYRFSAEEDGIIVSGNDSPPFETITLSGATASTFRLEVTIGIDFHWQQQKEHTFSGSIKLLFTGKNRFTIINLVPLETYILSVSCSEMSATSPGEFLKAHSIISRSWLLAQLAAKASPIPAEPMRQSDTEINRWYDRETHTDFDVCADDHCQRYQGTDLITSGYVSEAVEATRGEVLMFNRTPCDARFSKCCGGVTEDFRLAWGETYHPYLIPFSDNEARSLPKPPLSDETAARLFITGTPDAYCNCTDTSLLSSILNDYDQATHDFYRWQVRLTPDEIADLLQRKYSLDLGRITALKPVERGLSGRLKKLRITGNTRSVVIGKELEIRRALSSSHLYSSAFVIDTEGPTERPDTFILKGAGWGHGVGLCQIGAAVMAINGKDYRKILTHYYPGSFLEKIYR